MSQPTRPKPIPVGIFVSVSGSPAKKRPGPSGKAPPCFPVIRRVPWPALLVAGCAVWTFTLVGIACFANRPEPRASEPRQVAVNFAPAAIPAPAPVVAPEVPPMPPEDPAPPVAQVPVEPAPVPPDPPAEAPPLPILVPPAEVEIVRPPEAPVLLPELPPEKPAVCAANLGTNIPFVKDPPEAFKQARKEKKLVFMIHLAGNFEDTQFT
jgi:hypothetical protein